MRDGAEAISGRSLRIRGPSTFYQPARMVLREAGLRAQHELTGTRLPNANRPLPQFPLAPSTHWACPYVAAPTAQGAFPYCYVCNTMVPFRQIHNVLELLQLNAMQLRKRNPSNHHDGLIRFIFLPQCPTALQEEGPCMVRWNTTMRNISPGRAPRLFLRGRNQDMVQAKELLLTIVRRLESTRRAQPHAMNRTLSWALRTFA